MNDLDERRIQTARDHMRLEITHEWDAVIATFAHPRYEFNGGLSVADGEEQVRAYFTNSRIPFPDQANEIIAIGAGDDCVFVEFWLTGTHLGPMHTPNGVIDPTGKSFRVKMMATFEFAPGSDKIISERPYGGQSIAAVLGL